ncbi:peptidoglycan-binding protein [Streptomyces sp. NA04227]|uniref:peptidoglycan-binding protein n=1 Tax=Streptomyces sp. NA04227 TaxID=2742136 RepID=UPI001591B57D|nr:peptidoglycan-binding protein [Streptomyces sp. NA04227]QKW06700.1 peptidoglycan-binding protein [Streptomyces sp. NA04227]
MPVPVFEEYEPEGTCPCPGCRLFVGTAPAGARPAPGHAAGTRRTAGRVLVVAAAAGGVLGSAMAPGTVPLAHAAGASVHAAGAARAVTGAPGEAAGPGATPQGGQSGLHGTGYATLPGPTTRAEIVRRAKAWVTAGVPYSMSGFWHDGYRQDCSGFVSMAWGLGTNVWTGSLAEYGERIDRDELRPGDILLFHNPADPNRGSHVTVFGGWRDAAHRSYLAYEQTRPHTLARETPYPYWSHANDYIPYRYRGLTDGAPGAPAPALGDAFPGLSVFAPGVRHAGITRLGALLAARGGAHFYPSGPGPVWTDSDRRAVAAFQRAQGWRGAEANGIPGPATWRLLVRGEGRDIPGRGAGPGGGPGRGSRAAQGGSGVSGGTGTPGGAGMPGDARTSGPARTSGGTEAGVPGLGGREARGGVRELRGAASAPSGFPGREHFRPGKSNVHVARLGRQLVRKGYGRFYTAGTGPRWTENDRRAVASFQRAQGWRGSRADGFPGPETWQRLFS